MNKVTPDLGYYLAEQAIKDRYRPFSLNIEAIEDFCCQETQSANIYRTYLKLQRLQINRIAVDIVFQKLPRIKQRFLLYRYRDGRAFTPIAMQLHISNGRLNVWNREILGNIKKTLDYMLTEDDIFHRITVINMLNILDLRIQALSNAHIPVNSNFLQFLQERRKKYRGLLDIMQMYLCSEKNSVVATKLAYPEYNVSEIALLCELSTSAVSKHLRRYMVEAFPYIQ